MKLRLRRSEVEGWLGCSTYEGEGSTAASFGSLVHECIELYLNSCRAAACETNMDAIDAIVSEVFQSGKWNVAPEREAEVKNTMWRFAYTHVAGLDTLWGAEQMIEVDTPLAVLYGTLDRLDVMAGTPEAPALVRLIDWKTSWGLPDKTYPSFQALFYAGLLCQNWPTIEAVEMIVDHVRRSDGVATFMVQRPEIVSFWGSMLMRLGAALERRAAGADPTGGASCTYCRWGRECPESVASAREAIETPEHAIAEADAYVRLERSLKVRKETLKSWVEANGTIALPGLEVGYFDGATTEENAFGGRPTFRTKKVPLIAVESFEATSS